MEWVTAALAAFAVIVPVELPDKTFVATLVLSTRYQPLPVWAGVTAAFGERISPGPGTTMTLDAEHRLRDAVADLKRVLLRGAA